jgi:hypothetical protein
VGDVVSNYYGQEAEKAMGQRYEILKETTKPLGLNVARGHTKASAIAHNYVNNSTLNKLYPQKKELFKMKKFTNVGPRTNTNRPQSAYVDASTSAKQVDHLTNLLKNE